MTGDGAVVDPHLIRWLESRFDQLRDQFERLAEAIEKVERNHNLCRSHCDEAMESVYERLGNWERFEVGSQARDEVRQALAARIEVLEDRKVQSGQRLWIAVGAGATAAAFLLTLGAYVAKYLVG